jgi:ribosomal protein L37E
MSNHKTPQDYLDIECQKCNRKGFKWARPVCMYCGNTIDAEIEFQKIRNVKNKEFENAWSNLNITMDRNAKQRRKDHYPGPEGSISLKTFVADISSKFGKNR